MWADVAAAVDVTVTGLRRMTATKPIGDGHRPLPSSVVLAEMNDPRVPRVLRRLVVADPSVRR